MACLRGNQVFPRCAAWIKRYFQKNFKYYIYPSRLLIIVVWCAVLWSLLGDDALPASLSTGDGDCREVISNSSAIPINELKETITSIVRNSHNLHFYYPVGIAEIDGVSQYRVLLLHKRSECDIKNIRAVTVYGNIEDLVINGTEFLYQFNITDYTSPSDLSDSLLSVPSGHFFALITLAIVSSVFGFLVKFCCLPPLVGMIIAGFMLRNLPIVLIDEISPVWSSTIRNIALVIVLIRGGLAMSLKQLKRLKCAFMMLAFIPCVSEGILDGIIATFYLRLPWQWGFLLGFVIAAISPAIVVPTTLALKEKGYGVIKGIPTLVIGAASFDVVISISFFGVFLGLAFSEGNLVLDIFRAPIQIIIGILYGVLFGATLWLIPLHNRYCTRQTMANVLRGRFFILLGLSLFAVFGSRRAVLGGSSLAGSGPLAVVVLAFYGGLKWSDEEKKQISRYFYLTWQVAQPFLFGLIGAELDITFVSPSLIGQAFLLLLCGLILRLLLAAIVVVRNGFNWKEKLFVAIAWLPKATVQAAVGSIALDTALSLNQSDEDIDRGRTVLTIAVISIFLTAPLGGIAISLLGPVLLPAGSPEEAPKDDDSFEAVEGQTSNQDASKDEDGINNIANAVCVETTV